MSSLSRFASFWLLSVVCIVAGCDVVTLTKPVGRNWADEQLKMAVGLWITPQGEYVSVGRHNNTLKIGLLEFDATQGKFSVQTVNAEPRLVGDNMLLFLRSFDNEQFHIFWLKEFGLKGMSIRSVSSGIIVDAINSGRLSGAVTNSAGVGVRHVRVDPGHLELEHLIQKFGVDNVFPEESQVSLKRLSSSPDGGSVEADRFTD